MIPAKKAFLVQAFYKNRPIQAQNSCEKTWLLQSCSILHYCSFMRCSAEATRLQSKHFVALTATIHAARCHHTCCTSSQKHLLPYSLHAFALCHVFHIHSLSLAHAHAHILSLSLLPAFNTQTCVSFCLTRQSFLFAYLGLRSARRRPENRIHAEPNHAVRYIIMCYVLVCVQRWVLCFDAMYMHMYIYIQRE